jgi:hypothetical protein
MVGMVLGSSAWAGADETAKDETKKRTRDAGSQEEKKDRGASRNRYELLFSGGDVARAGNVSSHWIGLQCRPVDDVLRAHVDLPKGYGLVVLDAVADGPAKKAGVEKFDILLKANGKELADVASLVQAVEKAKNRKISLDLVRASVRHLIAVSAENRPRKSEEELPIPPGNDEGRLRMWVEMLGGLPGGSDKPTARGGNVPGEYQFQLVRPGVIFGGRLEEKPFPKGLKIKLQKEGDAPAKIVVEMDGKKWEVTEEKLDELPNEIGAHVRGLLGRQLRGRNVDVVSGKLDGTGELPRAREDTPKGRFKRIEIHRERDAEGQILKRLEEMNKRLDRFEKKIDQLGREK